jgi:Domain of unknown function (DUF4160)
VGKAFSDFRALYNALAGWLERTMPVVFRDSGLRFYFFSNEGLPREPRHIHVEGGGKDAKIWLEPEVTLAESYGFNSSELARILRIVSERRTLILKAWDDHFGNGRPL